MVNKEKLEVIYKDDLFYPLNWRKTREIIAVAGIETLGSWFLMVIGCTSYLEIAPVVGGPYYNTSPDYFITSFCWGTAYGSILVVISQVSGLFLNPALTVTMVILGNISIQRMFMYMICEYVGCILGVLFLKLTLPDIDPNFCMVNPPNNFPKVSAMCYELYGTFLLGLLLCSCYDSRTRDNFNFGPVKFAISIIGIHLGIMKFTGCSLNPARSVAAAIPGSNYSDLWIYIVGPYAGAIIAGIVYQLFFNDSIQEEKSEITDTQEN